MGFGETWQEPFRAKVFRNRMLPEERGPWEREVKCEQVEEVLSAHWHAAKRADQSRNTCGREDHIADDSDPACREPVSRWTLSWRSVSRCVSKGFIPKCPGSVCHWTQLIPSNPVKPSHKNGTAGARETARSGKYLPRRHKGLRLALLRLPVWRTGYSSTSRHWGGGDWQRSETLWAASLGKSASFRFRVRACPKNKMESNWRNHA